MAFEVIAKSFRACVYKTSMAGSEVVWRNQPRARSSTSRYALEVGSARLARKMDTYIWRSCRRCSRGEIPANLCVHIRISCCSYQSANSISSRGDYSRAASTSFRACSGAATIRERRLFERGVYSVIYGRPAREKGSTVGRDC